MAAAAVERYLGHALGRQQPAPAGVRLTMAGRIKVGRWLAFDAVQVFSGHAFTWRARAGWRRFKPVHVVDSYGDGTGSTAARLFGRMQLMHAADENTARAAAGRAAAESIWVPWMLVPERGVAWRAEGEDVIVARVAVAPEAPDVRLRIDDRGAVRSVSLMRWGNVGREDFGYIPFGADVGAERSFDGIMLPSEVTVGWWYGTSRYEPFFEARILDAAFVR
jgi:hypothetical protein